MLSRCYPGLVPGSNMVLSRCMPVCPGFTTVIALSHIYVPAAYRSRIYENFDTPRSEAYFVQATYVPRTSLLRSRGVSVTYLYLYGISILYVWRIKAYVLRTCVVCMAYEVYARRIYGICTSLHSYLRRTCSVPNVFNNYMYWNKRLYSLCSCNSHITVEVQDATEEI